MKKVLALIAAGILAAGVLCTVGCAGQNSEQLIRDSLTKQLDKYKNADEAAMTELATVAESEGLDEMGIDSQEFAAAVLDGFDYSIDKIVVNDNNATASVSITSKSYTDFENRMNDVISGITSDPAFAEMTEEEATTALGEKVMQAFDECEIITENADIEYTLKDNVWEPVKGDASLAGLDSIVFANE
ncbi:hypothetical protein [Adlercreutzia sp. ZJ154]|uniref:hypothetical protein n=1 Tax=Adlercreutzia sp. ZJ154 TaxID=2709790 RepID=UPI0013ED7DEC|nr:hypothetical protein [Adlercreutzia sp. ZJ154]